MGYDFSLGEGIVREQMERERYWYEAQLAECKLEPEIMEHYLKQIRDITNELEQMTAAPAWV